MTVSLRTDRQLIRGGARSNRYVLVSFTAPRAPRREDRRPINVAFVLDRSGSMAGENKFSLARQAVEQSLAMLRPGDRFSLVVYDDRVDVLASSANATPGSIAEAMHLLAAIDPRGSTDLCSGWLRGCEQVAQFVDQERVSRVLLLTDGLANHGTTEPVILLRHASELRQRGISTSTFGVGVDFDERLLRDMAHEGGGNFYFLEDSRQIPDLVTSELVEALEIVIPQAAIEIEIPHRASAEVLNRFRSWQGGGCLRIELGDVVSAQEVEVVVRMNFPVGEPGLRTTTRARLIGNALAPNGSAEIAWTYAGHAENDSQPRDTEVDRLVAAIYAARARADATEANRHGDFDAARSVIERTAARIRQCAGTDSELNAYWNDLLLELPLYDRAVMSPAAMKGAFYVAEMAVKGRVCDGKARRSP